MTISSTTVKNSYNGDGSTTTFSYTFKIFANSDLQVIIRNNTTVSPDAGMLPAVKVMSPPEAEPAPVTV